MGVSIAGCGMDKQVMERIFEQAGGHLSVESQPGRGTAFELCLPALPQDVTSDESPQQHEASIGRGETVLVAEDEDGVRGVVTRILSRNGYTVLPAPSGSKALDIFSGKRRKSTSY